MCVLTNTYSSVRDILTQSKIEIFYALQLTSFLDVIKG